MQTLREALKDHQEATDTDDNSMLCIVLEHIAAYLPAVGQSVEHFEDTLIDFVVESLERGPGVIE